MPGPSPWSISYQHTISGERILSNGFQKFFSVSKSSVECVLPPRKEVQNGKGTECIPSPNKWVQNG